jgi:hypothetical protein
MGPASTATKVILISANEQITIPMDELSTDDDIRLFTVIQEQGILYAVAHMDGELIAWPVTQIIVE